MNKIGKWLRICISNLDWINGLFYLGLYIYIYVFELVGVVFINDYLNNTLNSIMFSIIYELRKPTVWGYLHLLIFYRVYRFVVDIKVSKITILNLVFILIDLLGAFSHFSIFLFMNA